MRVDSGQVFRGNTGNTSIGVVRYGERCRRSAVTVVVSLYLGQGGVGRGDQGLHFRHSVCTACGLGQHLGIHSSQVICADASDASGHVVRYGERCRCSTVAVVVSLYLGQGRVGRGDQGLHFRHSVCTAWYLGQHLRVDGGQVVRCDTAHASGHVVGHGERCRRSAVTVVVSLYLAQSYGLLLSADQPNNFGGQVDRRLGVGRSGARDYVSFCDFIERGRGGAVAGGANGEVLNQQVDAGIHTAQLGVHA